MEEENIEEEVKAEEEEDLPLLWTSNELMVKNEETSWEFTIEGEDLLARAICHELDHLEGHMYVELVEGKLYTNEELDEMFAQEEAQAEEALEE